MSDIENYSEQIEDSLDKIQQNQQKRLSAQELKNQYYQQELERMKQTIKDLQQSMSEDSGNEQRSGEKSPIEKVDLSPLRDEQKYNDIQQELLKNDEQCLNLEDEQLEDEQENQSKQSIQQQDKLIQSESTEELDFLPKYRKLQESKDKGVQRKSIPKKQQNERTVKTPKVVNKKTEKPKEIKKSPQISTKKTVKFKGERQQSLKENWKGYLENVYESDLAFQHLQKRMELGNTIGQVKNDVQQQLVVKNKNEKIRIFTAKGKEPHCQKRVESKKEIRCERDQVHIKLFGRALPCNECMYFLSKGMSSELCSGHGKNQREKQCQKQMPKRFAKFML